jgi:hypothetical protein
MPEFLDVFDRLALPILLETLGNPVGFYISQVGPLNQFLHLWAYRDMSDYERRCNARDAHPEFPAYLSASAHLIQAQETRLIRQVRLPNASSNTPSSAFDTFVSAVQNDDIDDIGAVNETNQR